MEFGKYWPQIKEEYLIPKFTQMVEETDVWVKISNPHTSPIGKLEYEDLVRMTVEGLDSVLDFTVPHPDPKFVRSILQEGNYQGTEVFVLGDLYVDGWVCGVAYGSCTGCDTLQRCVDDYFDERYPEKRAFIISDLISLCMHILQSIKSIEVAALPGYLGVYGQKREDSGKYWSTEYRDIEPGFKMPERKL